MCKHAKVGKVVDSDKQDEPQERTFYYCDLERVGLFSELKRCEGATSCWWFKERHPNQVDVQF